MKKTCASGKFVANFVEHLAKPFFAPLQALQTPQCNISTFFNRRPPTETIHLTASDGVKSVMQMWVPPGADVPGASTDYQIYALPTIGQNFVDYLLERGYTVFCVNHRVGNASTAKSHWTTYDARHDIAAATNYILETKGASKIYSVVHCAGAQAMAAGLLDGTITGIGGLTASQVFLHPIFAEANRIKADIKPSMTSLYEKVVGPWFDIAGWNDDRCHDIEFMLNEALRFYPGGKQDMCHSIICHRSELVFGRYTLDYIVLIYLDFGHTRISMTPHTRIWPTLLAVFQ